MPLHKVTCVPRGHALGYVSLSYCLAFSTIDLSFQTSQLPLDDRTSVSYKEYLAEIDVCMGGRVAEELSKSWLSYQGSRFIIKILVYGISNISSGASSDIRKATGTAQAMVKVRESSAAIHSFVYLVYNRTGASQSWDPYFMMIEIRPSVQEDGSRLKRRLQSTFCRSGTSRMSTDLWLCRLVRGGETRAMTLLSSRIDELHRVSLPFFLFDHF